VASAFCLKKKAHEKPTEADEADNASSLLAAERTTKGVERKSKRMSKKSCCGYSRQSRGENFKKKRNCLRNGSPGKRRTGDVGRFIRKKVQKKDPRGGGGGGGQEGEEKSMCRIQNQSGGFQKGDFERQAGIRASFSESELEGVIKIFWGHRSNRKKAKGWEKLGYDQERTRLVPEKCGSRATIQKYQMCRTHIQIRQGKRVWEEEV